MSLKLILFNIIFLNLLLAQASLNWVGIYKSDNESDRIAIDNCNGVSCQVSVYTSSTPAHLLNNCSNYSYTIQGSDLIYEYDYNNEDRSQSQKIKTRILAEHDSEINVESTKNTPEALNAPQCQLPIGHFKKIFDQPDDPELIKKLSICRNVNSVLWVPLCFDKYFKKYLIAYLNKVGENVFLQQYKQEFDHGFVSRTQFETIPYFVIHRLYELYKINRVEAKILKKSQFEGIYESQRLSFSQGLSNWSKSLNFSNCKKNICDFNLSECSGYNFSENECEETRGQATFESENVIVMNQVCEDEKVNLEKTNQKWKFKKNSCLESFVISQPEPIQNFSETIYQASFDCLGGKLSEVESAICKSATLSTADLWLKDLYNEIKKANKKIDDQNKWLKSRSKCLDGELESCLTAQYERRIVDWLIDLGK